LILQARPIAANERFDGDIPSFRVGFTVSRKVGNAVARNRARRRLRAAVDKVLPRHGENGHDYVVIGRQGTLGRPFRALVDDLETALRKVHMVPGGGPGTAANEKN